MAYSKTEAAAIALAQPIAQQMGYQVYDCVYCKEGPHWFLRLFVTRPEGVSLDDCEAISRAFGNELDEKDLVKESYFLEVSSPGLDRVLRQPEHFESAVGEQVLVKLFQPVDGLRELEGTLQRLDDNGIVLLTSAGERTVLLQDIAKANVVFSF